MHAWMQYIVIATCKYFRCLIINKNGHVFFAVWRYIYAWLQTWSVISVTVAIDTIIMILLIRPSATNRLCVGLSLGLSTLHEVTGDYARTL